MVIILLLPSVNAGSSWPTTLGTPERSNYVEGVGNITYPVITHRTTEKVFLDGDRPTVVSGNVNNDSFPEIVASSMKTDSLYVFNHTLSLLWSFKELGGENLSGETDIWKKIGSLALGNISGTSDNEILFSMSDIDSQQSTLRVFKGDGTELWNRTFPGRITEQSLLVYDINGDGRNEVIVGAHSLYILSGNGSLLSEKDFYYGQFVGVSEIAAHGQKILASIWHHSTSTQNNISYTQYPEHRNLSMALLSVGQNFSIQELWSKEMKDSIGLYQSDNAFGTFYASPDFSVCYLPFYYNPTHVGVLIIDVSDGSISKLILLFSTGECSGSIPDEHNSYWVTSDVFLFSRINPSNNATWDYFSDYDYPPPDKLNWEIAFFDVNNDGKNEVVTRGTINKILFINAANGSLILEKGINNESSNYYPSVLFHVDTDSDGFDEIVTTDGWGRIVTIDSGTPPVISPPNSLNWQFILGVGAVAIVVIVMVSTIWLKRRKRNDIS